MSKPQPVISKDLMTPVDFADSATTTTTGGAVNPSYLPPPPMLPEPIIDNLPPPKFLSNPGAWNSCENEVRRILDVDTFDGAKFEFQKPLDQTGTFFTSHAFHMGSSIHPGGGMYQFGTTFVYNNDTLLIGRMDNMLRLDAQLHMTSPVSKNLIHRVQASVQSKLDDTHVVLDNEYKGLDFTATAKVGDGYLFGCSYFQAVTPRIALGGEFLWLGARRSANVTARARYTDNNVTAILTGSTAKETVQASFLRKVNNRVGLATEIEFAPASLDAHVSIGGEFIMRQSKFQANVTSKGIIQVVLQEIVAPNLSLLLSGIVDHKKDAYKFGVGLQLG